MLTVNDTASRTWAASPGELERIGTRNAHPSPSDRFVPLDHHAVADAILEQLQAAGYVVEDQHYALARRGAVCVGTVTCKADPHLGLPEGLRPSAGWLNANTGRAALQGVMGAVVDACTNGMLVARGVGATESRRSHAGDVDLMAVAYQLVQGFAASHQRVAQMVQQLTELNISQTQGDAMVVQAGMDGVLPWRLCRVAVEQWRDPDHPEFKPRNAWSLYNAMTEAAKGRNGAGQMDTLQALVPWWDRLLDTTGGAV